MIDDNTAIVSLGAIIKRRQLTMDVSFGSGGFCVILKTGSQTTHGYSWDLAGAIQKALDDLNNLETDSMLETYLDEEAPTRP